MDKKTKMAFDLGGVIVKRDAMENSIVEESYASVRLAVEKFGAESVVIISKAKEKYIQRNIDLLNDHQFFTRTGMKPQLVYFVNEMEDKGELGKNLQITHILDDSIKVAKIAVKYGFTPILFGEHENLDLESECPSAMRAKNWKAFRKLLQKIPK